MITELLPCPFCGSRVALSVFEDEPDEVLSAWVHCTCGVEIGERRTEEEAAMKWNTRARTPSGAAGAMREALATAYLIGRGMARASISTIREYQGETWLRALDEADKIAAFAAPQDGVK